MMTPKQQDTESQQLETSTPCVLCGQEGEFRIAPYDLCNYHYFTVNQMQKNRASVIRFALMERLSGFAAGKEERPAPDETHIHTG